MGGNMSVSGVVGGGTDRARARVLGGPLGREPIAPSAQFFQGPGERLGLLGPGSAVHFSDSGNFGVSVNYSVSGTSDGNAGAHGSFGISGNLSALSHPGVSGTSGQADAYGHSGHSRNYEEFPTRVGFGPNPTVSPGRAPLVGTGPGTTTPGTTGSAYTNYIPTSPSRPVTGLVSPGVVPSPRPSPSQGQSLGLSPPRRGPGLSPESSWGTVATSVQDRSHTTTPSPTKTSTLAGRGNHTGRRLHKV